MSDSQINTLTLYKNINNAAAGISAYQSARRLGIIDCLRDGQKTAAEIASAINANPRRVALLLDVLVGLLIVERYQDDYALSQMVHLLTAHDIDLGESRFLKLDNYIQSLDSVEDLRDSYRLRMTSTQWQVSPSAMQIAKFLNLSEQTEALNILDIGCGTGVWSLSVAHVDPESRITFLDKEDPVRTAVETAESIGMEGRITAIHSDPLAAQLPTGDFNLVIVANILHLLTSEEQKGLLLSAAERLQSGGKLVVVDVFPGQDAGDVSRALFALDLELHVPSGKLVDPIELKSMIEEAGLQPPRYSHLNEVPHIYGIMVAQK
ncbi:MAG: hypothetical protein CMJ82_11410 [Planctomycetaceae bacterium]|nr:hypothetical protein [Planctomycetaceae bacterium]|tara:strand:+ start:3813 stop:4775 length:963 start_codon:yes stop_codon:yes gene_type:complete